MIGILSKLFGGNKSEKDVKKLLPQVENAKEFFAAHQALTNDQLRNKTQEFRQRIQAHLADIDALIITKNKQAEELPAEDINGRD
ncbi:MAG: hypothetical protein H7258_01010, partial [Ferruginibacter sp.]|nr:hypothetical protein [Ferruginibacter sp.]